MFTKSTVSQSMIDAVNSILDEEKKVQQLDEASAFDWKANKNETDPKFTTKKPGERTGHESKKTDKGVQYTKKPVKAEVKESFKDRLLTLKNAQRQIQTESKTFDELLEDLNDEQVDKLIFEVLGKDADAGDYIHDFIHSKNSKFAGKSKEERKKMALGAYYGKHNEEVKDEYARKVDKYLKKKYNKEEVEGVDEALIGKQKKLDKNHNGKLDGQDFKILRSQKNEGVMDTVKKVGGKVLKTLGHGSDADMIKDLAKKTGVNPPPKTKTEAVEPTAVTTDTLAGPVKGGKPNQHSSIKVKLKAEAVEKDNKPPFDPPYTKAKGNIKDKSGAIHTPMSRARDLARTAMKKVKAEMMMGKAGGTSE